MKVTLIGTLPPLKGISPYCLELTKAISELIFLEFIGFKDLYPDTFYPGGTKIISKEHNIQKMNNVSIKEILRYFDPLSWIKTGLIANGTIIHVQWWSYVLAPIYIVFLTIFRLRHKKIIITVHNVLPHEINFWGWINIFLNKIVLLLGHRFIVHSYDNAQKLTNLFGIDQAKISVIPHGILKPTKIRSISKEEARDRILVPKKINVILLFGNLREYKGLDILLSSLKIVKQKIMNIILIIAGQPWIEIDGYNNSIRNHNLENNIVRRLKFIPPSEVKYYFSASDVIVLPYKYFDSQSGVAALSLYFKKPLIVTDVGGLTNFVKDERAIAKPNDPQDLARKIIEVLNDRRLQSKLVHDSKLLNEKYSWDKIAELYVKVYVNLISSK